MTFNTKPATVLLADIIASLLCAWTESRRRRLRLDCSRRLDKGLLRDIGVDKAELLTSLRSGKPSTARSRRRFDPH